MKLSRSTRWRLALGDLKAQPWRTLLAVLVLTPLAASWFLLAAVSRSLAGLGTVGEERNIVVTEPDVFDVANVHLGAEHLATARSAAGADAESVTPLVLRTVELDERVLQLRAADPATWEPIHSLTVLEGTLPDGGADEMAVTAAVQLATGWEVGDRQRVFGTELTITAVLRGSGSKVASLWLPLDRAEQLFDRPGEFQFTVVRLRADADGDAVRARLRAAFPGLLVLDESAIQAEAARRAVARRPRRCVHLRRNAGPGRERRQRHRTHLGRTATVGGAAARDGLLAAGGAQPVGGAVDAAHGCGHGGGVRDGDGHRVGPAVVRPAHLHGRSGHGVVDGRRRRGVGARQRMGRRRPRDPPAAASNARCSGGDVMHAAAVVVGLALRDMRSRWRVMAALGVMVALTVGMVVLLDGYVNSTEVRFRHAQSALVVQQQGTVGEFAGSRIPASVGEMLRAEGYDPVAEVHAVAGTSGADAVMIAGVDPDRYRQLDPYRLVSGRHLRAGETQRTAIVGTLLADRRGLRPGDVLRLRGRDFAIVGVFELGIYLDDAAIVPIGDAQTLLGWGSDVSVYVVPEGGALADGTLLDGGLAVATRGDIALVGEWAPMIALLVASVRLLALGAVAVLVIALWRLAWLHRIDLGVLRLLGFGRRVVAAFLGVQAAVLVATAAFLGGAGAVFIAPYLARTSLAVATMPVVDGTVLWRGGGGCRGAGRGRRHVGARRAAPQRRRPDSSRRLTTTIDDNEGSDHVQQPARLVCRSVRTCPSALVERVGLDRPLRYQWSGVHRPPGCEPRGCTDGRGPGPTGCAHFRERAHDGRCGEEAHPHAGTGGGGCPPRGRPRRLGPAW